MYRYVPESPRYLILEKKYKQVDIIFKKIALSNKRNYESQFENTENGENDTQSINTDTHTDIVIEKSKYSIY